jgi:hypothetical protein
MSVPDGSTNKKITLTFEEIAPDWSKRLNKLAAAKGISYEKDPIYSDINDYGKCIVGEAYGYRSSYIIYGTVDYCRKCSGLSHDFVRATKRHYSDKLMDAIKKLTEHWNEVHIDITNRLRRERGA